MNDSVARITACSITFSSSRTLPGQSWDMRAACADLDMPTIFFPVAAFDLFRKKRESRGMSSLRSRKRRNVDHQRRNPVEQVLSELAILDLLMKVLARCGDHTALCVERLVAAYRPEFSILENPEQVWLKGKRKLSDFVQKQGAFTGGLKKTHLVFYRAGKGSLFVPKQFRFYQGFLRTPRSYTRATDPSLLRSTNVGPLRPLLFPCRSLL